MGGRRAVAGWVLVAVVTLSPASDPIMAQEGARPRGPTVLLTGDSVSVHLEDTLARVLHDLLGWRLVSAAVPSCSIHGYTLAWPGGTPKGDTQRCPGTVASLQTSRVQQADPEYVIWWDRLSTMPFVARGGEFVPAGSDRFWELRAVAFERTVARLTAGGARIVFVATEPMGRGVLDWCAGWSRRLCQWKRYRMRLYSRVTQPLNRIMRRYAVDHARVATFIAITDTICRSNVSPCDDRLPNGKVARPDGTHYVANGELRASRAIVRDMRRAWYG